MRVQTGPRPEEIRQSARHALFIEGASDAAFDPVILRHLVPFVDVRPMGPSSSIRAAAEAMHQHHPDYYFLIDRDHHDDDTVERSWERFPDPAYSNILIWRKREIENYFLDARYLVKSQFVISTVEEIEAVVRGLCQRRLYLYAANLVLIALREEAKEKWIEVFRYSDEFVSREGAMRRLTEDLRYAAWIDKRTAAVSKDALVAAFERAVDLLAGGTDTLQHGRGKWIDLVRGKDILPSVIDQCCQVRALDGRILQGSEARQTVGKDLLSLPLGEQPGDFRQLHSLLENRLSGT